ncbi:MAG: hypothetical protein HY001_05145 [Candidatus Portnoybacteria bacterium]|nr:hypothetical protein [Candidatus Portnoybacteria bacterium]
MNISECSECEGYFAKGLMNFVSYLKYEVLPWVKVKLRYWWWILKYGGKKKIPPEIIFGALAKSLERMNENLTYGESKRT